MCMYTTCCLCCLNRPCQRDEIYTPEKLLPRFSPRCICYLCSGTDAPRRRDVGQETEDASRAGLRTLRLQIEAGAPASQTVGTIVEDVIVEGQELLTTEVRVFVCVLRYTVVAPQIPPRSLPQHFPGERTMCHECVQLKLSLMAIAWFVVSKRGCYMCPTGGQIDDKCVNACARSVQYRDRRKSGLLPLVSLSLPARLIFSLFSP